MQLADFLAGTIRKVYEGPCSAQLKDAFLLLARHAKLGIEEWPPALMPQGAAIDPLSEHDSIVRRVALNGAALFIIESGNSPDTDVALQLLTVKYLLFKAKFEHGDYISTGELLQHLAAQGYPDTSEHQFKSMVISRLRDKNVLISSSNRGYKIPLTYQDFLDFVELVSGQVVPLIERLNIAQCTLFQASMGQIRALDQPHLDKLRRIASALESE